MRLATTRGTNALLERQGRARCLLRHPRVRRPPPHRDPAARRPLRPRGAQAGATLRGRRRGARADRCRRVGDRDAPSSRPSGPTSSACGGAACGSPRWPCSTPTGTPGTRRSCATSSSARGFEHVSVSSALAPRIQILPRAETAVVDAYLAPVDPRATWSASAGAFRAGRLHVMTSAGGLSRAALLPREGQPAERARRRRRRGRGAAARRSGFERILTFDMGGHQHRRGPLRRGLRVPVRAAGGRRPPPGAGPGHRERGGRRRIDLRLRFRAVSTSGPESAGAHPGPACYGAGGPLTLTDVNLLLGRLAPARFAIPIDAEPGPPGPRGACRGRLREETGEAADPDELLEGFLEIANERMADPIRAVSLRRGYDPADYALVAFGGAGGQHACAVAERLGIATVLVPPRASLLSAEGLADAVVERFEERQVLEPLSEVEPGGTGLAGRAARRPGDRRRRGRGSGAVRDHAFGAASLRLRFVGQDSTLAVELAGDPPLGELFASALPRGLRSPSRGTARSSWSRSGWWRRPGRLRPRRRRRPPESGQVDARAAASAPASAGAGSRLRSSSGLACPRVARLAGPRWSSRSTAPPSSRRAGRLRSTAREAIVLRRAGEARGTVARACRPPPARWSWSCSPTASGPSSRRWGSSSGAPPSPPTSRSASTSPAPCSTRAASWW